jgi:hypothetical protein
VEEKKISTARLQHPKQPVNTFPWQGIHKYKNRRNVESGVSVGSTPKLYKEATWTSLKESACRQANPYVRLL